MWQILETLELHHDLTFRLTQIITPDIYKVRLVPSLQMYDQAFPPAGVVI
jgi:hypothetical protein